MKQSHQIACDVFIVGGGINGVGIARDAAGRGLSVVLCEKDDLASHTSSASSKLIHGGLRYLEHYEFGLVRKALTEREVLLRAAPHLIRPLRFVLPHDQGQRPAWIIRIGLFLYDHLARRTLLPASCNVDLRRHETGLPLKDRLTRGFMYSDGWVDDARLVVLNAIDAAEKGARILTRTRCDRVVRQSGGWRAILHDAHGAVTEVTARCLINACGPWAGHFLHSCAPQSSVKTVRLVKGSHIVVKRLFEHDHAYIFQHSDGRIVFAIPYERDFTLIGTTDIEYHGDPDSVTIDADEIAYLCALSNRYFRKSIAPDAVVWSYAGVRPLVEDGTTSAADVTRDYRLEFDTAGAPLLSIFGGKITTFRRLAQQAVDLIAAPLANTHGHWTEHHCLPGGDPFGPQPVNRSVLEFQGYVQHLQQRYAWLAPQLVARYAQAYGTRIAILLAQRHCLKDLGQEIAPGLFAAEVDYWMRHEWATCADDMLWRRSKLGLHLPGNTQHELDAWIAARLGSQQPE